MYINYYKNLKVTLFYKYAEQILKMYSLHATCNNFIKIISFLDYILLIFMFMNILNVLNIYVQNCLCTFFKSHISEIFKIAY